jgi:hypothetical protein
MRELFLYFRLRRNFSDTVLIKHDPYVNSFNFLLISLDFSQVTLYFRILISGYSIRIRKLQLIFIVTCILVYKMFEDPFDSRNLDIHIDQFSEIMSKCCSV